MSSLTSPILRQTNTTCPQNNAVMTQHYTCTRFSPKSLIKIQLYGNKHNFTDILQNMCHEPFRPLCVIKRKRKSGKLFWINGH